MILCRCNECGVVQSDSLFIMSKDDKVTRYFMCPTCKSRNVEPNPYLVNHTAPLFDEQLHFHKNAWSIFRLINTNYVWFVEAEDPKEELHGYSLIKQSYFAYVEAGVGSKTICLWSLKGDTPIKLGYHFDVLSQFMTKYFKQVEDFPHHLNATSNMRGLRNILANERVSDNLKNVLGSCNSTDNHTHIHIG